jgi:hypothetical protein
LQLVCFFGVVAAAAAAVARLKKIHDALIQQQETLP